MAPSGRAMGATRKSSSPPVWYLPTPPRTVAGAVGVAGRSGAAVSAATAITPRGRGWQLTVPFSAVVSVGGGGGAGGAGAVVPLLPPPPPPPAFFFFPPPPGPPPPAFCRSRSA